MRKKEILDQLTRASNREIKVIPENFLRWPDGTFMDLRTKPWKELPALFWVAEIAREYLEKNNLKEGYFQGPEGIKIFMQKDLTFNQLSDNEFQKAEIIYSIY